MFSHSFIFNTIKHFEMNTKGVISHTHTNRDTEQKIGCERPWCRIAQWSIQIWQIQREFSVLKCGNEFEVEHMQGENVRTHFSTNDFLSFPFKSHNFTLIASYLWIWWMAEKLFHGRALFSWKSDSVSFIMLNC